MRAAVAVAAPGAAAGALSIRPGRSFLSAFVYIVCVDGSNDHDHIEPI